MKKVIILNLFILLFSITLHSQQLTKELILPYKYIRTDSNTFTDRPIYNIRNITLDDSTFLLVTLIGNKHKKLIPEKIQPVLIKIRNSKEGFRILWQSKPYLDSTFSAYFGDMIIENGKYKMVFLYQNDKNSFVPPSRIYYPFFIDINPETGQMIDSVGFLGDFSNDAYKPNSRMCYIKLYDYKPYMHYDGRDLIIPMLQTINQREFQYVKNISRTGVINKIVMTRDTLEPDNKIYIIDSNNYFEYVDRGIYYTVELHSNYKLIWKDTLAITHKNYDMFNLDKYLLGSDFSGNNYRVFIQYSDKALTTKRVYTGVYNEFGKIKSDTINLDDDVYFGPEFATIDENGIYYLSGMNLTDTVLSSFQVVQYKNQQKKSLIWKKNSDLKYIFEVNPSKNDKAIALGVTLEINKNGSESTGSFYIAEIDFSLPNNIIEEKENLEIDISPNPAGDFITINISGINPTLKRGVDGTTDIFIYNTLGEKVITESIHPMTSSHRMNIESLPKGMYFVKVGGETAKFVKL